MNLVEHYFKDIHNVKEEPFEFGVFIIVDATTDCYGRIERGLTSFPNWESFNDAKEKGYYMA